MHTANTLNVQVELGDGVPSPVAGYARRKIRAMARFSPHALRHAHIRIVRATRQSQPSVLAHVSLDVDGTPVVAHAVGSSPWETVDLAQQKLRGRLTAMARAGGRARRDNDLRRVVRRSHTGLASPASPVAAVSQMSELDYEIGLFTEAASHQDSVLARQPDGGYRLTQLSPRSGALGPCGPDVELEPTPPPAMNDAEAILSLGRTRQPFVFYQDRDTGRGRVAYRRADGGYGLIGP